VAHEYTRKPAAIEALNSERCQVTQRNGTEQPFTGEYWDNKEPGVYSGTGWPSTEVRSTAALRVIHRDDLEAEGYGEYRSLFGDKEAQQ
jgi:peptide-methionine (R)-S-oxide reductase